MAEDRTTDDPKGTTPGATPPKTPDAASGATPSGERRTDDQAPATVDTAEPNDAAKKEELATDVSEVAEQRLSRGEEKTNTTGTRKEHAEELAEGVAGKPADDGTAAAVEQSPSAPVTESVPAPKERGEVSAQATPATETPAPAAKTGAGGTPAVPGKAAAAKPAAPAKPPEPEPDEIPALKEAAPDLSWERRHGYVEVKLSPEKLLATAQRCKELGYDYLSAVTGVDWRDRVEMLYHLYGYDYVNTPGCIVLRVDLPPDPNPLCPSLTPIWPGAEFQEREVYDLFGVKFVGNPDLRRILTEDAFPGHPLRKDWVFDYEYVLVRHLRHGAEGQAGPPGGQEGYRHV